MFRCYNDNSAFHSQWERNNSVDIINEVFEVRKRSSTQG